MTPAKAAERLHPASEAPRVITPPTPRLPVRGSVATPTTARIGVHVDALVLHGFPAAQRLAIAGAIERELARLFAERPLPTGLHEPGRIERIDAGTVRLARDGRQPSIGALVARVVFGSLQR